MKMPRPTDEDKRRFLSLLPDDVRVVVKPMFGNLGASVNGNMFMGLFGADVGVKLDPGDREALSALGGGPFGPEERPMGGYVTLPADWGAEEAGPWVAKSLALVAAMPPKAKKK